jgi:hypothetical protein
MKLDLTVGHVQDTELDLARELRATAERHAAEPDVYHLGHTLARSSDERRDRLEPFASRYGAQRSPTERPQRSDASELALIRDLGDLYLAAQAAELAWVVLLQAARAARDGDLVVVAGACREGAEACARWARGRIKEAAPQAVVAG